MTATDTDRPRYVHLISDVAAGDLDKFARLFRTAEPEK